MARYLGFEPTNKESDYHYLSYNSEDMNRIIPIMDQLNYKGLDFWYDYGIQSSEDWSEILAKRIEHASDVLMFLTRQTLEKEDSFVYKEYWMAKHRFDKKIHIVLLDEIDIEEVPNKRLAWWIEIQDNQNIEGWKADSIEALCDQIINALGGQKIREEKIKKPKAIILEESSDSDIPSTPNSYWLLRLFFIVLEDANGNLFLPLQYPSYGGIWTVPHIAYQLQSPRVRRPKSVDSIIDYIDKGIEGLDDLLLELEYQQYYQMGMFNNESKEYTTYTEYKTSPTLNDRFNCYRIEECHITYIDPNEMINLYDPDHLHNYRYLPLKISGEPELSSPFVELKNDEIYFFGKPLSSNITRALSAARLKDCTYRLPEKIVLNEYGFYENLK